MKFNEFIAKYENIKANEVVYLKTIKTKGLTAKAIKDGNILEKISEMIVTKFDNYADQATVQYKVENEGKVLTHQLPWGVWNDTYKGIIDHKDSHYARFYFADDNLKANAKVKICEKPKYFLNGNEVTREYLENSGLVTKAFWGSGNSDDCLTINIDNVLEMA